MGKAGSMWQSSIDGCKSAGHEKGHCSDDYRRKFRHAESLHKNGTKTAE